MWAPLACLLLRAAWQSIAERLPTQAGLLPSWAGWFPGQVRLQPSQAGIGVLPGQASLSELSTPGVTGASLAGVDA